MKHPAWGGYTVSAVMLGCAPLTPTYGYGFRTVGWGEHREPQRIGGRRMGGYVGVRFAYPDLHPDPRIRFGRRDDGLSIEFVGWGEHREPQRMGYGWGQGGLPMHYRRVRVAGGTYFFTVNLADRSCRLLVERIHELRAAVQTVKRRHPFVIDAMVVLPEHLHTVWTLPESDADYSTRWGLIKAAFSRSIAAGECPHRSRTARGERGIWQRRFWEHTIRDDADLCRHIDYIHYNPVKHGYVTRPVEWPFSSIHRHIRAGDLPADWGGDDVTSDGFGEP